MIVVPHFLDPPLTFSTLLLIPSTQDLSTNNYAHTAQDFPNATRLSKPFRFIIICNLPYSFKTLISETTHRTRLSSSSSAPPQSYLGSPILQLLRHTSTSNQLRNNSPSFDSPDIHQTTLPSKTRTVHQPIGSEDKDLLSATRSWPTSGVTFGRSLSG